MGNPPWISYRYLDPDYQKVVRNLTVRVHRLLTGRGHLITHMEVGTLFLIRAADLYLKEGGTIGFVLPRSVISADQHDEFRRGTFRLSRHSHLSLVWQKLWDCEKVTPLFNVPACVLWGKKVKAATGRPSLIGEVFRGDLPRKNASLHEAEENLTVTSVTFALHQRGRRTYWAPGAGRVTTTASFYKKRFFQGATIVPRTFWFVQIKPSPLGLNPQAPPFVTDPRAIKEAKRPYNDVQFSGQVEAQFLYATLLSTDILPFGHLPFRMVVLPIEPQGNKYKLLDTTEARKQGFSHLARWLGEVERAWKEKAGPKAAKVTALEWLDYRQKLTNQNPNFEYLVIYNSSGTIPASTVIRNYPVNFDINGHLIVAKGFILECVTFFLATANPGEAFYLNSILNAPEVNNLIKSMQERTLGATAYS